MLQLDSLPVETRRLFDQLSGIAAIAAFTLIGGTALTLSWGHRFSEDLDFAFPGINLPRKTCDAILQALESEGWSLEDITDPVTRLYHENEGADLADTQQDWLCRYGNASDGVKMTFFSEYKPVKQEPYRHFPPLRYGHLRIMPPDGIFLLKSQVLLHRNTLRDLFDLWSFLERGKTIEDVLDAIHRENRHFTFERLRSALFPARMPETDPGLACMVQNGPADLPAIKTALRRHVDDYEIRLAARTFLDDSEPFTP